MRASRLLKYLLPSLLPILLFRLSAYRSPHDLLSDSLQAALSVVDSDPDSCLSILESLPPISPTDSMNTALYGVLWTECMQRLELPSSPDSLCAYALRYYTEKDGPPSLLCRVHVWTADRLIIRGDYPSALWHLHQAERLQSSVPPALRFTVQSFLGYLARATSDFPSSERHYLQALSLQDRSITRSRRASAWCTLLSLPRFLRDTAMAVCILDTLQSYVPHLPPTSLAYMYNNIGWYHEHTGHRDSAVHYYRKAVAQNAPGFSAPWTNLSRLQPSLSQEMEDSLQSLLSQGLSATAIGTVYRELSSRRESAGDLPAALNYQKRYASCLHSHYERQLDERLQEVRTGYGTSLARLEHRSRQRHLLVCMLSVLFALCLLFVLYRHDRDRELTAYRRRLSMAATLLRDYRRRSEDNRRDASTIHRLEESLRSLTDELSLRDKQLNRWKVIFNANIVTGRLTGNDIEACAVYIELRNDLRPYDEHRDLSHLCHWLNLTDNNFVLRLTGQFAPLQSSELTTLCLLRLGYSPAECSRITGSTLSGIRQRIYRLAGKFGLPHDLRLFRSWVQNY